MAQLGAISISIRAHLEINILKGWIGMPETLL